MTESDALKRVRCVILGAGGHAKVLIDSLTGRPDVNIVAAVDPDPAKRGQDVLGVPVVGDDELLPELVRDGVTHFVTGLGSACDNRPREALFRKAQAAGLFPVTVVHPRATISQFATLGDGCQALPGAIVNAGAHLGMNVIVNSGAIVEHDCIVGNHAHIATGARLASTVRVGDLAFIGVGASIRQCVTIGEAAVVGAGAVVVSDVRAGTVVVGVPARDRSVGSCRNG